jgi:hypothetical protein
MENIEDSLPKIEKEIMKKYEFTDDLYSAEFLKDDEDEQIIKVNFVESIHEEIKE